MYPNLYYFFKEVFGITLSGLKFVNSFGFFVAWAFIAAAIALTAELKRKERLGYLTYQESEILVGKGANWSEVFWNAFFGFLIGFKLVGAFILRDTILADPQGFILSSQGSLPAGLIVAAILGGLKFWQGQKQKLPKPEKRTIRIWPHDRVGDMIILAALFGFGGAKLFHNFENWNEFIKDPIGALVSLSGLTFYGGLICAGIAIVWFAKKRKIGIWHLTDAFGPAMMIAYAVGRIGCQVSGDGDWGILNSAYISAPNGKAIAATQPQFDSTLQANTAYYLQEHKTIADVPHLAVAAPSWLPNGFFAYSFPNNVLSEGVRLKDCNEQYCSYLPVPVFPTSFYETVVCTLLFLLLWVLRKKIKTAGILFGVYLIFNGIERFFVEKIRVNTQYHFGNLHPTQAEIISTVLVLLGVFIILLRKKYGRPTTQQVKTTNE